MVRMSVSEAKAVASKTEDAYSFGRFTSWNGCAQVLRALGYDAREAEAVMRSKHMRWAGDCSSHPDRPNSKDLRSYLDGGHGKTVLPGSAELAQLVRETFA